MIRRFNRRTLFRKTAGLVAGIFANRQLAAQAPARQPVPVASVITVYAKNSHADVILGKILEGFDQQGGQGPALKLVGLYVDQTPRNDLSRALAEKHGFRIARTIDEALTLGTDQLQVRGVLSIGEHGSYPYTPDTDQHLYPRKRFFDEIVACFRRVGQVVPIFNDKHFSYRWEDAKSMFDRASEMKIPLMAGSSLPVTWRRPSESLPLGCSIDSALAVGYGGLESYGFHALEMLQCMVERRGTGEQGIEAVRVLRGNEIRLAVERDKWPFDELFAAALQTMPDRPPPDLTKLDDRSAVYQLEYRDGLKAAVVMANGLARHFAFAARVRPVRDPIATWFELDEGPPFRHFGFLLKAIEHMVHTGQPAYPAARTLLTTGILDAVMHAAADGGARRETPDLTLNYQPVDWPFAM